MLFPLFNNIRFIIFLEATRNPIVNTKTGLDDIQKLDLMLFIIIRSEMYLTSIQIGKKRIRRTFIIVKSTAGNNETNRAAIWSRCKT